MIWALLAAALAAAELPPPETSPEALLARGYDAMYRLDYDLALALFAEYARRVPDSPRGDLNQGTTLWLQTLQARSDLRLDRFTNAGHFAEKTQEASNPEMKRRVLGFAATGRAKAEKRLAANPDDLEALYLVGASRGLEAAWQVTVEHDIGAGISAGGQARKIHQQVVDADPEYWDAYLSLGLYDYVTGSLPFYMKWVAYVMGYKGNRTDGLRKLELAATRGQTTQRDARLMLVVIYQREKRPEESLRLLDTLTQEIPANAPLRANRANVLVQLGRPQEAETVYATLEEDVAAGRACGVAPGELALAHARVLLDLGDVHAAVEKAASALTLARDDVSLKARAQLALAMAADLAGSRDEAIALYRAILEGKSLPKDMKKEALGYLRKPFTATRAEPPRSPTPEPTAPR